MTIIDVTQGDITAVRSDVIVNAANRTLLGGGGVDGAIHRAGGPDILRECELIRAVTLPDGLDVGAAVATTAGRLPARWVIHTVGPRWSRNEDRSQILRLAYSRCLLLARSLGADSIAFPLISGGAYGWPVDDAVAQQVRAIKESEVSVDLVTLVAYSADIARLTRAAVG
ncbi:O-acetyl-ADP-ribose deacetylase [Williamsia sp.]|uniref:O-acetyl-ADP-ribose deacetylase n=1 Tax=Williamsia sp. TaxID=1872085 RepID=UPI0025F7B9CE|nr:O-acetyl-ADP-ribose deacetylase [Williamsia sp.]